MEKENKDKQSVLAIAIQHIEKQFGKGAVMRLGDKDSAEDVEVIPSGSLLLDRATGIGGFPRGRMVEIYGQEASGKTTLSLHTIAQAQAKGGVAAFIDAEHALDVRYARNLGVDISSLLVSQPDCGEQALEITESLVRSNAVDIVVIDSVAALVPRAEIEGEMGEMQVGLQARLMSQALRKLTAVISKSRSLVIFINQTRTKIGTFFGNPETTTGGNALKFYASMRVEVQKVGPIKRDEKSIGVKIRAKIVKNKLAPPFREATLEMIYGLGIDRRSELLELAMESGLVHKSGSWYYYGQTQLGQGREDALERISQYEQEILAQCFSRQ